MASRGTCRTNARAEGKTRFRLHVDGFPSERERASDERFRALAPRLGRTAETQAINGSYQARQRLTSASCEPFAHTCPKKGNPLILGAYTLHAMSGPVVVGTPIATSHPSAAAVPSRGPLYEQDSFGNSFVNRHCQ